MWLGAYARTCIACVSHYMEQMAGRVFNKHKCMLTHCSGYSCSCLRIKKLKRSRGNELFTQSGELQSLFFPLLSSQSLIWVALTSKRPWSTAGDVLEERHEHPNAFKTTHVLRHIRFYFRCLRPVAMSLSLRALTDREEMSRGLHVAS